MSWDAVGYSALATRLQGQGLGSELLMHALATIIEAARAAGGRLVVVDAIDEDAVSFYRSHDFQPPPADPRRVVWTSRVAVTSAAIVGALVSMDVGS